MIPTEAPRQPLGFQFILRIICADSATITNLWPVTEGDLHDMELTSLESQSLDHLLSLQHPCAATLGRQLASASGVRREWWTTVGFFTHFEGVADSLRLKGPARVCFKLASGQIADVPGIVNIVLFVDQGLVHFLEGHLTRFDWSEVQGPDWPDNLRESVQLEPFDDGTGEQSRPQLLEALELFTC